VPSTRASNSSIWPSGQATQSADTKCALRCEAAIAPRARSSSSTFCMALEKSRDSPAQRAE
jgi:hypothetical protein